MAYCKRDIELYHHGIKGQKWGVRRGPPYPIDDTVLRKGTKLSSIRVQGDDISKQERLYVFNPEDEYDAAVYRGPYAMYKMEVSGQYIVEQMLTVNKDLKMPTYQQRYEAFKNLYSKNPRQYAKDLQRLQDGWKKLDINSKEEQNVNLKRPKTDADYKAIFKLVNAAMDHPNSYKIAKDYSEIMSKTYDAMVDDQDQGTYNHVHDPIIIFKVNECLSKYGNEKLLSYEEMNENLMAVGKEMVKLGEEVTI